MLEHNMKLKVEREHKHVVQLNRTETSRLERRSQRSMLISTKVRVPPLRTRIVRRTELVDQISRNKDSRLIVVSGMAGSGKTSLICQWIEKDKPLVAWYSLDSMDDDTDLFFRYILFTLSGVNEKLALTLGPMVQDKRKLLSKEVIASVIEALVEVTEDIYLIINDYHLITSREIHDALIYIINNMPANMHVIIESRQNIPFPLSNFKVRNQMIEISAEDIRFTEKETKAFFTEVMPVNLSTDQMCRLSRYTEGWVGGLQLIALSLKDGNSIPKIDDIMRKTCHDATDYLINEVIDAQNERVKLFFYATALLDRFNTHVCCEITGLKLKEVSEILDYLYQNNLFLIALNTERTWYRYNHLFSDVIRSRTALVSGSNFRMVHQKAARWFANNGCLEDAFRHAFSSGEIEFAADFLEDYVDILYERHDNAFGLRWIEKLPHSIFMQRPMLRLFECLLKIESYDLFDIQAFMENIKGGGGQALIFDRYDSFKKKRCEDLLTYLKYVFPYYSDLESRDMKQLDDTLQKISPKNKFITCLIEDVVTVRHLCQGNPVSAAVTLEKSMPIVFASGNLWNKLDWFKTRAFVERWQGNLQQSDHIIQKAFLFLDRHGFSDNPMKSILYLPMAWAYYFRNDLDNALEYADIAMRYMERTGYLKDFSNASWAISFIHIARGENVKAEQYIQSLSERVRLTGHINWIDLNDAVLACLSLAQGNLRRALQWENRKQLRMDQPFSYRLIWEGIAHGEILYRQGMYEEAVNMLEILRGRCVEKNMMEAVLSLDLLQSAALYALDEYQQAKIIMEEALTFSESKGYIRQFVNYRKMISPLLIKVMEAMCKEKISSHTLSLMQACGIKTNGAVMSSGPDTLTPRETEILKLLVVGYKYREIADKTFVSFETVKTHVKNIYDKLNVNTRDQAIQRTQDWNML